MEIKYVNDVPNAENFYLLYDTTGWNANRNYTKEDLVKAISNSWYLVAAYYNNMLIGFGRIISDGIYQTFIGDLIVHPDYQKNGIGSNILTQLVEKCKVSGIKWIQLTCAKGKVLIGPMIYLLRYSFNKYDPRELMIETFTLENYVKFFTNPYFFEGYLTTIRVGILATIVCLIFGFPLAYVLARSTSRYKNLMIIAIVVPLFVGNAVRAAGWMSLLGSRGLLSVTLMNLGITSDLTDFMYSEGTVISGIIAVNLPYMVLSLQSVIEGINRNLEEAAFSMGAAPMTMFRRVLLPMALPGVAAGTILTFILAMNAYATPVLLGGPSFRMMAPLVYGQFQLNNWPAAAAIAFILMLTTLVLTMVVSSITKQRFRAD